MGEWISVRHGRVVQESDIDSMGRVLVWNDFSKFACTLRTDYLYEEPSYTHWQPLPEPPK